MRVLVFAPHNDDEILGVGGTMKKFINAGHEVFVCEATSGSKYQLLQTEAKKAHEFLGVKGSYFLNLPVNELRNTKQSEINAAVSRLVNEIQPQYVFIPHKGDMHMDHGELAKAAMVAVRPVSADFVKYVYAYETLSETEWNIPCTENAFMPNVYVDISETIEDKINAMSCYQSQLQEFPNPRSLQAIRALSEFRGSTICVHNAEAFMLIRDTSGLVLM